MLEGALGLARRKNHARSYITTAELTKKIERNILEAKNEHN